MPHSGLSAVLNIVTNSPVADLTMALLSNVLGFSLFGLATRFGQLGIQRRNLFDNPGGHAIAMGVFGVIGYWAHHWDIRAAELLEAKRAEIRERRGQAAIADE